jgi:hypothetical protein
VERDACCLRLTQRCAYTICVQVPYLNLLCCRVLRCDNTAAGGRSSRTSSNTKLGKNNVRQCIHAYRFYLDRGGQARDCCCVSGQPPSQCARVRPCSLRPCLLLRFDCSTPLSLAAHYLPCDERCHIDVSSDLMGDGCPHIPQLSCVIAHATEPV